MTIQLTRRQREVLRLLEAHVAEGERPPTYREIGEHPSPERDRRAKAR
jgi:SOS-response transcriptional repressor LexA